MACLNHPVESVGAVSIIVPSNLMVTVLKVANPVPVIVVVVPPRPVAADKEIDGVTVKVAVAAFPMLSAARTVRAPGFTTGTVNDAVKLPNEFVKIGFGIVTTNDESNVMVTKFA
jgi:hypothetical protein